MFRLLICFSYSILLTLQSDGVCPRTEIPCAGTCTIRIAQSLNHDQAAIQCRTQNKRIYMGSRIDEDLETGCANAVFGGSDSLNIWSRYKLRDGLIVDERGVTIDRMNWGIKYCGVVDQLGNFMPLPCSWNNYRAICVSNQMHYDKTNLKRCSGEYYWVTDRTDLDYERAVDHCRQNNMVLVTPYTNARKNCFHTVLQARGVPKAWIDYNITAATQKITPWDREYCIKVNRHNEYTVDKCETKLPAFCSSFGELEASGVVVQKGKPAVLSCKCYNCTVNDIEWTDGMTVWRSGDDAGGFQVRSVPDSSGVRSTLTLTETLLDQSYTCVQRTQFSDSVIYKTVEVDVYNLEVTSHYVFYASTFTITCKFNNDKHLDIDRVEWSDRRDNTDLSGRARLSYEDITVVSKLEILAEYYTHDIKCTFYARGEGITAYSGISRIIVYKIVGEDQSVPASANTTLTCDLKEQEGRSVDLVAPTRVDWKKGDSSYILPSEINNPFRAVLVRNMRTGEDKYVCRFLFENGNRLTKTLTVTAFDFEGIPALVANGTTATLNCKYSKGAPPDTPLWWEREGVRISDGKTYNGETYEITSNFVNEGFYVATTTVTVRNASFPATFQCGLRVSDNVWRKDIGLKVYMGKFIASNVTITEKIDPETGQIVVNCSVWANPRPNIQLFVDTEAAEGVLRSTNNKTTLSVRIDQTCEAARLKCLASSNEGTREAIVKSKLDKKCGFLQKLTLPIKLGIGGALLLLIIIIIVICCCFCRKTKELKEEVEYHREVLSQVDGTSTMYSMNLSRGGKSLPPKYEDMYSENGTNNYDPIVKGKTYLELNDTEVADYQEPFSEVGLMSPKYQRIESDYEPVAPLFMSRSKSRDNMTRSRENVFSPPQLKKSATTLSYQNLKEQSSRYPSVGSMQKSNLSRSAQNLQNPRKFSQPATSMAGEPVKMNPFGNVQRLKSGDPDDEVMSITSKIPPSEMSDMTPPVAILSPRGWEIPDDPGRMFSPPTARRPRMEYERKFSEPASSPWQDAQDKVKNWNLPPTNEQPGLYDKPPKSGWSTPAGPLSTVGESTGKSSATLDTISVTPTFLAKTPAGKPISLPKPHHHPADRVADCVSPPPMSVAASSNYPQSSVGPSASQYQPSPLSPYQSAIEKDRQRHNLQNNVFDIDDLSSVDVPENGMDTLDRRVQNAQPAAENFYTPPRGAPAGRAAPQGVKVLPGLPKKPNLRTSHF